MLPFEVVGHTDLILLNLGEWLGLTFVIVWAIRHMLREHRHIEEAYRLGYETGYDDAKRGYPSRQQEELTE